MGYKNIVAKSFFWVGTLRGITLISTLIKFTIAARILGPSGMGIYGIASLVLALLMILTETGVNALLVQNENNISKYIDTYWVVSFVRGFVISLLIFLFSYPVSIFFHQPNTFKIVALISLVPLINGFINPSIARFQKELEFKKELFFKSPIVIIDAVSAVILLLLIKDPSALIWGMVISSLFELLLSWIYVKPIPKFKFKKILFKEMFHKGKWITTTGIFTYFFTEGDDWFVGKLLGTLNLGYYQLAYKIATLPTTETANIILRIVFPTFVKIKDDIKRLRRAYLLSVLATILFISPYIIFVYIFTTPLIVFIFGIEWVSIVGIVKLLLIFSFLMSVFGISSGLFLSVNKQKFNSNMMMFSVLLMLISIVPLINKFGLMGAVYSILFSFTISCFLNAYYVIMVLEFIY